MGKIGESSMDTDYIPTKEELYRNNSIRIDFEIPEVLL